jgi:DNA-binding transcriptional ArsR family regulator
VIHLRLSVTDLERVRFAYSPLAEVAESLHLLTSDRAQHVHRGWFQAIQRPLRGLDMALLRAVVPGHPRLASFLLIGAVGPTTTIEDQLKLLAECPPDVLRDDLRVVWEGQPPPVVEQLIAEGVAGCRRLTDALWSYWSLAIEPHWPRIRAVLDADVAYRASRLTGGGIEALFSDLHPELSVSGRALHIDKPRHSFEKDLAGTGLLLVPSVFAWPNLVVDPGTHGPPSLTYACRGVGTLWETGGEAIDEDDALGALIGRSRAAILNCLELPHSTTELAHELGQTAPAVSQHLSVLRRSGLVTSWRSGRRVLYRQTLLGKSVVAASRPYEPRTVQGSDASVS